MCGIVGVHNHPESARIAYRGLLRLQHRGHEGWGLGASDGHSIVDIHKRGTFAAKPLRQDVLRILNGSIAIGHVRYSTQGLKGTVDLQPYVRTSRFGQLALVHNGDLTNFHELYQELIGQGYGFTGNASEISDTEVMLQRIIASHERTLDDAVMEAFHACKGAFSVIICTPESMIVARDPYGVRPLVLGKHNSAIAAASETCALDYMHIPYEREIAPGEVCTIDRKGIRSKFLSKQPGAACIFEDVYFAAPDSIIFGHSTAESRIEMGRNLAREAPVPGADYVTSIPRGGTYPALGFAHESGLPYIQVIDVALDAQRSFIRPDQATRQAEVEYKLRPIRRLIDGKKIVVVEDSIVRGTTTQIEMNVLRECGAREIHLRVASAPIRHPCFYGIDFKDPSRLIYNRIGVSNIAQELGVESCVYLSLEGMTSAATTVAKRTGAAPTYCTACFSGNYPIDVPAR